MDFLIVPTVGFRLLFVQVIHRHQRRRLISLSATAHPVAAWIARQITDAFPWMKAPDYLIQDRDASYGQVVAKRLEAMGIRDHPTAPRSSWQNGYAERLIRSIRRDFLDRIIIFGEAHLRRIVAGYTGYYDGVHRHLSLDKGCAEPSAASTARPARSSAGPRRPSSSILPDSVCGRRREPEGRSPSTGSRDAPPKRCKLGYLAGCIIQAARRAARHCDRP
jgi:hypothetical protein